MQLTKTEKEILRVLLSFNVHVDSSEKRRYKAARLLISKGIAYIRYEESSVVKHPRQSKTAFVTSLSIGLDQKGLSNFALVNPKAI